jgi:hypothetical protein
MTISNKRPSKRRFSREESGLRYDMQQFYSMKVVLEQLFGKPTYQRLKETASLKDWKDSTSKLLRAIELSIRRPPRCPVLHAPALTPQGAGFGAL